jgi:NuA3 HAT complex component NTO1
VGLLSIRERLQQRFYPSVAAFSSDLASLFTSEIGVGPAGDTAELQAQISGRAPELSLEQREKRKLAKRIIKVIQPSLEDAIRKESELNRKPFEKELKELDLILDHSIMSRSGDSVEPEGESQLAADPDAMEGVEKTGLNTEAPSEAQPVPDQEQPEGGAEEVPSTEDPSTNAVVYYRHPTPVLTEQDQQLPLAVGGIQWYMQPFDPVGTTVHEERWTGRDVMRGMSEELSDMDEEELEGLKDMVDDGDLLSRPNGVSVNGTEAPASSQQNHRQSRRLRTR